jgi:predicted benzoate:H+ symporter BenE
MKFDYSWKKTIWKGVQIFVFGGIGALVSHLSGLPPTETIIAAIAILKMLQNWLKYIEW